jgi:hypothetical protein
MIDAQLDIFQRLNPFYNDRKLRNSLIVAKVSLRLMVLLENTW